MLKYKITNIQWCIRWENRKDFLNNEYVIRRKKYNKIAVICLFYSSFNNIKRIYTYIESEKKSEDFDLILVNNSWKNQNFEHELQNNNIVILTPISNLWTDWGYSLWMEYCIDKWYKYLFLIEDDVTIFDNNAFSDVMNKMDEDSVWFITPRVNDNNWPEDHSWHVQFACYPISFLKKSGILDPRFFTRWWDGLWVPQVEKTIRDNWYKKVIVKKKHFHPYLKKWNWSAWRTYFAWRNLFYRNQNWISNYIKLFLYILNWICKFVINHSLSFLKWLFLWIYDYMRNCRELDVSLSRMSYLWKYKIKTPSKNQDQICTKDIILDKIYEYSKWYFAIWLTQQDENMLKTSKKIWSIFSKGIIVPNVNSIVYSLSLIVKNNLILNEIYQNEWKFFVNFTVVNRKNIEIIYHSFLLLFCIIISTIIYIPILIMFIINNNILKRYKNF